MTNTKWLRRALLGGVALSVMAAGAQADELSDLKAQLEALQSRVNTLETFNDPVLRRYFRSEDLFFDYYAELAQSLADAHFEKSRPFAIEVQEMVFESTARAHVQVLFRGFDNRPLRPNRVSLVRRDRWQYEQEAWWIAPGKL